MKVELSQDVINWIHYWIACYECPEDDCPNGECDNCKMCDKATAQIEGHVKVRA
jgi:hypothetical protein